MLFNQMGKNADMSYREGIANERIAVLLFHRVAVIPTSGSNFAVTPVVSFKYNYSMIPNQDDLMLRNLMKGSTVDKSSTKKKTTLEGKYSPETLTIRQKHDGDESVEIYGSSPITHNDILEELKDEGFLEGHEHDLMTDLSEQHVPIKVGDSWAKEEDGKLVKITETEAKNAIGYWQKTKEGAYTLAKHVKNGSKFFANHAINLFSYLASHPMTQHAGGLIIK